MYVNVIKSGETGFNALISQMPSQQTVDYFRDNVNTAANAVTNIGSNIFADANVMFNRHNSDQALYNAKLSIYNAGIHMDDNIILRRTIDNIHLANLGTQRYIMANPTINELYVDNMCDGFSDTYVDLEPGVVGTERMDYRNVMNNSYAMGEHGVEGYHTYTHDDEDIYEVLSDIDRMTIRDTWDVAALLIADGVDPTDPNQGDL